MLWWIAGRGSRLIPPIATILLLQASWAVERAPDPSHVGQQTPHRLVSVLDAGHHGTILAIAFSNDGQWLATASSDHTVRLWDASAGLEIRTFSGHTDAVTSVAFSPDGESLLTGCRDGTARLWDVDSGSERTRLLGHQSPIRSASFSPDRDHVLTVSERTVRIWARATGAESSLYHKRDVRLVIGAQREDETTAFSHLQQPAPLPEPDALLGATFAPDGEGIFIVDERGSVIRWFPEHGDVRTVLAPQQRTSRASFSPDGRTLLSVAAQAPAVGEEDPRMALRTWDLTRGEAVAEHQAESGDIESIAVSNGGQRLLVGTE